MTKARLTSPELGRRAGVGDSWIRQLVSGRIQRPAPAKLRAIARELGLDEAVLLGMTDQLGAAVTGTSGDDTVLVPVLLAELRSYAALVTRLVQENHELMVAAGIRPPTVAEHRVDEIAAAELEATALQTRQSPDPETSAVETPADLVGSTR